MLVRAASLVNLSNLNSKTPKGSFIIEKEQS